MYTTKLRYLSPLDLTRHSEEPLHHVKACVSSTLNTGDVIMHNPGLSEGISQYTENLVGKTIQVRLSNRWTCPDWD